MIPLHFRGVCTRAAAEHIRPCRVQRAMLAAARPPERFPALTCGARPERQLNLTGLRGSAREMREYPRHNTRRFRSHSRTRAASTHMHERVTASLTPTRSSPAALRLRSSSARSTTLIMSWDFGGIPVSFSTTQAISAALMATSSISWSLALRLKIGINNRRKEKRSFSRPDPLSLFPAQSGNWSVDRDSTCDGHKMVTRTRNDAI